MATKLKAKKKAARRTAAKGKIPPAAIKAIRNASNVVTKAINSAIKLKKSMDCKDDSNKNHAECLPAGKGAPIWNAEFVPPPARRVSIPAGKAYLTYTPGERMTDFNLMVLCQSGVLPNEINPNAAANPVTKENVLETMIKKFRHLNKEQQNEVLALFLGEIRKERNGSIKYFVESVTDLQASADKALEHGRAFESICRGEFETLKMK